MKEEKPPIDLSGIGMRNIRYALSGFVAGVLIATMSYPKEASSIPTIQRRGIEELAFLPITSGMLLLLFAALIGIFLTFHWRDGKQSRIEDYSNEQSSD